MGGWLCGVGTIGGPEKAVAHHLLAVKREMDSVCFSIFGDQRQSTGCPGAYSTPEKYLEASTVELDRVFLIQTGANSVNRRVDNAIVVAASLSKPKA